MVRLYAWASIFAPLVGMLMSMISHRYAYMYAGEVLCIVFIFAAFGHLKNDRVNNRNKET